MIIAKQMDIRSNIKKYFDMAYEGETIIVPRKQSRNVVIMSEERYNNLNNSKRIEKYIMSLSSDAGLTGNVKSDNLRKLEAIGSLRDNWNGNGAPALPEDVVDRVKKLIDELPIQPEVFPTALKTIQLEYDNARHDHMEIEIGDKDTVEVFTVLRSGDESVEQIVFGRDTISEKVLEFYG